MNELTSSLMNVGLTDSVLLAISIVIVLVTLGLALALYAYYRNRLRAALGDAQDAAEFAAQRDRVAADVEQMRTWLSENREELLRLDAERETQERLRQELAELETAIATNTERLEGERRESLELQHAITSLANDRDRIEQQINDLKSSLPEHEEKSRQLRSAIDELTGQREAELQMLRKLEDEINAHKAQISQLMRAERQLQSNASELEGVIANLESRRNVTQAEAERIETELQRKRAAVTEVDDLSEKTREKLRLDREISALEQSLAELREDEDHRTTQLDTTRYADLLASPPDCLSEEVLSATPISTNGGTPEQAEEQALERVFAHLENQSLIFPQRVVRAFHTSLKVGHLSPITVLAGVSGTGKSELPLRYAEAMGMHRLSLAVQPSWSSPQDLFGFYNYLEKRYKATDLARALVRMDPYNFGPERFPELQGQTRKDRILLVLLDEMNLSRVEYYFSEFLSRLEARRAIGDASVWSQRMPAEIEIDGPQGRNGSERGHSLRVFVGGNVLFTGTMNEDESTQTLSDKVLDRANVLRFGRPPMQAGRVTRERKDDLVRDDYLPYSSWCTWERKVDPGMPWHKDVSEWIERLNEALGSIGRPFGWRVKQAMAAYVANYPGINARNVYRLAMADQVEHKILPKLRGIDVGSDRANEALDSVQAILDALQDEELTRAFDRCRKEASDGPFNWTGVTRRVGEKSAVA